MIDPLATSASAPDASAQRSPAKLRTRVVREARRETWFVVNEGIESLPSFELELRADAALRRVDVNGEVAEFTVDDELVEVTPRRELRAGAGTIVVLHLR